MKPGGFASAAVLRPGLVVNAPRRRRVWARGLRVALAVWLASVALAASGGDFDEREAVSAFIDEMVEGHDHDRAALVELFGRAQRIERVLELIARPAEKSMSWSKYRALFLDEARVAEGIAFWRRHQAILLRAQHRYRVPATLILSVLGVETRYGKHTGKYKVLDSLATLSFDYPPRSRFFRGQLKEFLLMVAEQGLDPHQVKGSYAGAIGYGQFIPSSYRHYAVDFDGDGAARLEQPEDAIGSIANYLAEHGWREGGRVVAPTLATPGHQAERLRASLKPALSIEQLADEGFIDVSGLPASTNASVFALPGDSEREHWFGLHNFYVISRYNPSAMYAMAVHQLGERLGEQLAERLGEQLGDEAGHADAQ